MALPKALKEKFAGHLQALIAEGKSILQSADRRTVERDEDGWDRPQRPRTVVRYDRARVIRWRTRCATLLADLVSGHPTHGSLHTEFQSLFEQTSSLEWGVNTLEALAADFRDGFLDRLADRIEAEVVGDLMGQAETLLTEGDNGRYDHLPAGVLAGAVLERFLRSMCESQQPELPIKRPDGEPLKAIVLVESLKAAGAFTELDAKMLRAWVGVRNECAHGHFDKVTRDQVRFMLDGVSQFVARHSGA